MWTLIKRRWLFLKWRCAIFFAWWTNRQLLFALEFIFREKLWNCRLNSHGYKFPQENLEWQPMPQVRVQTNYNIFSANGFQALLNKSLSVRLHFGINESGYHVVIIKFCGIFWINEDPGKRGSCCDKLLWWKRCLFGGGISQVKLCSVSAVVYPSCYSLIVLSAVLNYLLGFHVTSFSDFHHCTSGIRAFALLRWWKWCW